MRHSRVLNNKLNRLHKICLRFIHNDRQSTFEQLLEKDSSVQIQITKLHTLVNEMYNVANGSCPIIMNKILKLRDEVR